MTDQHTGSTIYDLQALVDSTFEVNIPHLVLPRVWQAAKQRPTQFATNKNRPSSWREKSGMFAVHSTPYVTPDSYAALVGEDDMERDRR